MKRYLLFGFTPFPFLPRGGADDLKGHFDYFFEIHKYIDTLGNQNPYYNVLDTETGAIYQFDADREVFYETENAVNGN